jgi:hypothetical protein
LRFPHGTVDRSVVVTAVRGNFRSERASHADSM